MPNLSTAIILSVPLRLASESLLGMVRSAARCLATGPCGVVVVSCLIISTVCAMKGEGVLVGVVFGELELHGVVRVGEMYGKIW